MVHSRENTGQLVFQVQDFLESSMTLCIPWPPPRIWMPKALPQCSVTLGHELISNN